MPGEHGVVATRLLGEELIEVDDHALAAQLPGDARRPALEEVALPRGVVAARHHHVDDRVPGWIAAVLTGRHVVEVLAGDGDLPAEEPVVDLFDPDQLVLRQDPLEVHESVALEQHLVGGADQIVVAMTTRPLLVRRLVYLL